MTTKASRRDLLRALGVSAAVAPFVPLLERQVQAAAPPRRLVLVYCPNGTVGNRFFPTGGETDFSLAAGGILEPLAPFKKDIIVPRNVARDYVGPGGNHQREIAQLWTYAPLKQGPKNGGYAQGPSIDQIIAAAVPQPTPFKSLEASVYPERVSDTAGWMCYSAPGQPIFSVDDPRVLFQRIVGNAVVGGSDAATVMGLWTRRKSVMDVVKAELEAVQRKVDRADTMKIQAHLESMRGIEQRLQALSTSSPTASTTKGCAFAPIDPSAPLTGPSNIPRAIKLQTDLIVSALACDRTRIASLQWTCGGVRSAVFSWLGQRKPHHDISHDDSPAGEQQLAAIHRWYAEQVAYLLGRLSGVPEGNGSMLDNTLVVFANGLYLGKSHIPGPIPVVFAGRLGGSVRPGRSPDASAYRWPQLLLSICHLMGANVSKVGEWTGPAATGLFA